MARYLVLRVDTSSTADKLIEKFQPLSSVDVVGLFASPDKFCEGNCVYPDRVEKNVRSRKWGTLHCTICKLPKKSLRQSPRNLLQDPDIPAKYVDMYLSVWEPFVLDPVEKYGEAAIEGAKASAREVAETIKRQKTRRTRRGR